MTEAQYNRSVFVNCPLDDAYRPLLQALVFAIYDSGYEAHAALEVNDASQVRIEKICAIIANCKFGVHDISRTELDAITGLPRFNMPLELGLFLGAKRFGDDEQKAKNCLVLDGERYRYQKFISDIAGQDIATHQNEPIEAIRLVRDWLRDASPKGAKIPGGAAMVQRCAIFRDVLPAACKQLRLSVDDLTFNEYIVQVEEWLRSESDMSA